MPAVRASLEPVRVPPLRFGLRSKAPRRTTSRFELHGPKCRSQLDKLMVNVQPIYDLLRHAMWIIQFPFPCTGMDDIIPGSSLAMRVTHHRTPQLSLVCAQVQLLFCTHHPQICAQEASRQIPCRPGTGPTPDARAPLRSRGGAALEEVTEEEALGALQFERGHAHMTAGIGVQRLLA